MAPRYHSPMDFDISRILEEWDFQPGQVVVRRFQGVDGQEKIQLRVDLGLLQMNTQGRPDGKRPFGHPSLLEYHQSRLYKYVADHGGTDDGYRLKPEDISKLQVEALQYHQRYFCLLQLEDYDGVIRDAERNLALIEFVNRHAHAEEVTWGIHQFQPQLLMVLARARAAQVLKDGDYALAIEYVEEGLATIRAFYAQHERHGSADESGEVASLENWVRELRARRPLTPREKLELALQEAVSCEDYERAAQVRDELKNLVD